MTNEKKKIIDILNRKQIINNPIYGMIFNKSKFKTPENYSFKHNEYEIDSVFEPAFEEDVNGYILHRISLVNNKTIIGYIKVSYVPEETFNLLCPNILYWLDVYKGVNLNLNIHKKKSDVLIMNKSWDKKNIEEKKETLLSAAIHINYNFYLNLNELFKNQESVNLEEQYKKIIKMAKNKYKNEFDLFKETIINKPKVEFSKIKGEKENMNQLVISTEMKKYCLKKQININDLGEIKVNDINFLKTGLGEKLYILMTDWLGFNNLNLYKGNTNENSERLWKKLFNNKSIKIINDNGKICSSKLNKNKDYLKIKKQKTIKLK